MKIRKTTEKDLTAVLALYAQARIFMAKNGNPDQWGDGYPEPELVEWDIARENSYVCVEITEAKGQEEILAVFFYSTEADADYAVIEGGDWLSDAPYGVVHRIAASSRRRGVASFCLDWAYAACGNLRIDTHEKNIPMRKLLQKQGFAYCGKIHTQDGSCRMAFQKNAVAS